MLLLKETDNYYALKEEPAKSCLLALRSIILKHDQNITEAWKYKMPFFCYKGKMFCYLWVQKDTHIPYLGLVEGKRMNHPKLLSEKRSRMKIMLMDPKEDLPIDMISSLLSEAISFYTSGLITIR